MLNRKRSETKINKISKMSETPGTSRKVLNDISHGTSGSVKKRGRRGNFCQRSPCDNPKGNNHNKKYIKETPVRGTEGNSTGSSTPTPSRKNIISPVFNVHIQVSSNSLRTPFSLSSHQTKCHPVGGKESDIRDSEVNNKNMCEQFRKVFTSVSPKFEKAMVNVSYEFDSDSSQKINNKNLSNSPCSSRRMNKGKKIDGSGFKGVKNIRQSKLNISVNEASNPKYQPYVKLSKIDKRNLSGKDSDCEVSISCDDSDFKSVIPTLEKEVNKLMRQYIEQSVRGGRSSLDGNNFRESRQSFYESVYSDTEKEESEIRKENAPNNINESKSKKKTEISETSTEFSSDVDDESSEEFTVQNKRKLLKNVTPKFRPSRKTSKTPQVLESPTEKEKNIRETRKCTQKTTQKDSKNSIEYVNSIKNYSLSLEKQMNNLLRKYLQKSVSSPNPQRNSDSDSDSEKLIIDEDSNYGTENSQKKNIRRKNLFGKYSDKVKSCQNSGLKTKEKINTGGENQDESKNERKRTELKSSKENTSEEKNLSNGKTIRNVNNLSPDVVENSQRDSSSDEESLSEMEKENKSSRKTGRRRLQKRVTQSLAKKSACYRQKRTPLVHNSELQLITKNKELLNDSQNLIDERSTVSELSSSDRCKNQKSVTETLERGKSSLSRRKVLRKQKKIDISSDSHVDNEELKERSQFEEIINKNNTGGIDDDPEEENVSHVTKSKNLSIRKKLFFGDSNVESKSAENTEGVSKSIEISSEEKPVEAFDVVIDTIKQEMNTDSNEGEKSESDTRESVTNSSTKQSKGNKRQKKISVIGSDCCKKEFDSADEVEGFVSTNELRDNVITKNTAGNSSGDIDDISEKAGIEDVLNSNLGKDHTSDDSGTETKVPEETESDGSETSNDDESSKMSTLKKKLVDELKKSPLVNKDNTEKVKQLLADEIEKYIRKKSVQLKNNSNEVDNSDSADGRHSDSDTSEESDTDKEKNRNLTPQSDIVDKDSEEFQHIEDSIETVLNYNLKLESEDSLSIKGDRTGEEVEGNVTGKEVHEKQKKSDNLTNGHSEEVAAHLLKEGSKKTQVSIDITGKSNPSVDNQSDHSETDTSDEDIGNGKEKAKSKELKKQSEMNDLGEKESEDEDQQSGGRRSESEMNGLGEKESEAEDRRSDGRRSESEMNGLGEKESEDEDRQSDSRRSESETEEIGLEKNVASECGKNSDASDSEEEENENDKLSEKKKTSSVSNNSSTSDTEEESKRKTKSIQNDTEVSNESSEKENNGLSEHYDSSTNDVVDKITKKIIEDTQLKKGSSESDNSPSSDTDGEGKKKSKRKFLKITPSAQVKSNKKLSAGKENELHDSSSSKEEEEEDSETEKIIRNLKKNKILSAKKVTKIDEVNQSERTDSSTSEEENSETENVINVTKRNKIRLTNSSSSSLDTNKCDKATKIIKTTKRNKKLCISSSSSSSDTNKRTKATKTGEVSENNESEKTDSSSCVELDSETEKIMNRIKTKKISISSSSSDTDNKSSRKETKGKSKGKVLLEKPEKENADTQSETDSNKSEEVNSESENVTDKIKRSKIHSAHSNSSDQCNESESKGTVQKIKAKPPLDKNGNVGAAHQSEHGGSSSGEDEGSESEKVISSTEWNRRNLKKKDSSSLDENGCKTKTGTESGENASEKSDKTENSDSETEKLTEKNRTEETKSVNGESSSTDEDKREKEREESGGEDTGENAKRQDQALSSETGKEVNEESLKKESDHSVMDSSDEEEVIEGPSVTSIAKGCNFSELLKKIQNKSIRNKIIKQSKSPKKGKSSNGDDIQEKEVGEKKDHDDRNQKVGDGNKKDTGTVKEKNVESTSVISGDTEFSVKNSNVPPVTVSNESTESKSSDTYCTEKAEKSQTVESDTGVDRETAEELPNNMTETKETEENEIPDEKIDNVKNKKKTKKKKPLIVDCNVTTKSDKCNSDCVSPSEGSTDEPTNKKMKLTENDDDETSDKTVDNIKDRKKKLKNKNSLMAGSKKSDTNGSQCVSSGDEGKNEPTSKELGKNNQESETENETRNNMEHKKTKRKKNSRVANCNVAIKSGKSKSRCVSLSEKIADEPTNKRIEEDNQESETDDETVNNVEEDKRTKEMKKSLTSDSTGTIESSKDKRHISSSGESVDEPTMKNNQGSETDGETVNNIEDNETKGSKTPLLVECDGSANSERNNCDELASENNSDEPTSKKIKLKEDEESEARSVDNVIKRKKKVKKKTKKNQTSKPSSAKKKEKDGCCGRGLGVGKATETSSRNTDKFFVGKEENNEKSEGNIVSGLSSEKGLSGSDAPEKEMSKKRGGNQALKKGNQKLGDGKFKVQKKRDKQKFKKKKVEGTSTPQDNSDKLGSKNKKRPAPGAKSSLTPKKIRFGEGFPDASDYIPLSVPGPTKFGVATVNSIQPYKKHNAATFKNDMLFGARVKRFVDPKDHTKYLLKQKAAGKKELEKRKKRKKS